MPGSSILCLNAGSSSLKFKLFDLAASLSVVCQGVVERIGTDVTTPNVHVSHGDVSRSTSEVVQSHVAALERVERYLKSDVGVHAEDVVAVGHRVVMGGAHDSAVVVDDRVKTEIKTGSIIAPLHNPANLLGIEAAEAAFATATQVAVFDTAFHRTVPACNSTYALPRSLNDKYSLRKYGFHGTSYRYLVRRVASLLGKDVRECNLVVLHLGAGASMCAIKRGNSVDTTMGLTPTAGLVMSTRSGDVDPSVVAFLADKEGLSADEVETILNSKSGLLGLSGLPDMRDVHAAAARGDPDAELAIDVFVARIRHYLGAYLFELGGRVDAVVFSAGIGEHDPEVRRRVVEGAEWAGIELDPDSNEAAKGGSAARIDAGSRTQVWVVPTDEELGIAEEVAELLLLLSHEKG